MAMTSCRECGAQVSDEAETCPSCGIENPCKQKNVLSSIGGLIKGLFGWAVIIVIGLGIIGYLAENVSQAECELVSRSLDADMFFIDGEPDARRGPRLCTASPDGKGAGALASRIGFPDESAAGRADVEDANLWLGQIDAH